MKISKGLGLLLEAGSEQHGKVVEAGILRTALVTGFLDKVICFVTKCRDILDHESELASLLFEAVKVRGDSIDVGVSNFRFRLARDQELKVGQVLAVEVDSADIVEVEDAAWDELRGNGGVEEAGNRAVRLGIIVVRGDGSVDRAERVARMVELVHVVSAACVVNDLRNVLMRS